ncbi:hypothetical protein AMTRI_Chr12g269290 [Amborella trichopoda]
MISKRLPKSFFFFFNIVKDVHVLCYTNSSIVTVQVESRPDGPSNELLP